MRQSFALWCGLCAVWWAQSTVAQSSKLPCDLRTVFYLWNAETNAIVGALNTGDSILAQDWNFNVEARGMCDLFQSMAIAVQRADTTEEQRVESIRPFMAFGDTDGIVHGQSFQTGTYNMTAVAYGEPFAKGPVLTTWSLVFTVVETTLAPAGVPAATPVSAPTSAATVETPVATRTRIPVASITQTPVAVPTTSKSTVAKPTVSSAANTDDVPLPMNPVVAETDLLCPCWDEAMLNATLSSVPWTSIAPRMNTYQAKPSWLSVNFGIESFQLANYGGDLRTCSVYGVLHRLPNATYDVCKAQLLDATEMFFLDNLRSAEQEPDAAAVCPCYSQHTLGIAAVQDNVFSMVTSDYAVQDYRETKIQLTATDALPGRTEPTCSRNNYGGHVVDASKRYDLAPAEFRRCHLHQVEAFLANAEALI